MRHSALLLTSILLLTIVSTQSLSAQEENSTVVQTPVADDFYAASEHIEIRAPIAGDLVVAGRDLRISSEISDDVIAAGETVLVEGSVGDDVRAAGRTVTIAALVEGHLIAAGETVTIAPGQRIGSWAWLAGDRIAVAGSVGSLRAYGNEVTISGDVRGPADIRGETIRLAPNAVIRGDLTWASPNPLIIGEGARIEGSSVRVPFAEGASPAAMIAGAIFWIASFALAVALVALALPRFSLAVGQRARTSVGRSLLAGIAVVFLGPLAVVLALASGVLWLVGLMLLAAYLLSLAAGLVFGIYALSDVGLELVGRGDNARRGTRIGAAVIAAIVIAAIGFIPVLGPLAILATTILGAGAMTLSIWGARREAQKTRATAAPVPA
jgi:hypothetical protein